MAALAGVALAGGVDDNNAAGSPVARPGGGPDEPVECANGTISGAGATFPQAIVQQWIKEYGAACPGATVTYQPVGSGAGIQQFSQGTVDFGASDAVMKPDELAAAQNRGPVLHVPWTSGGIAVMYNLPGVRALRLSPEALAGVYAGRITRWNDRRLAADNQGAELPDAPIQVVHRSDGSGTTAVFTAYLTAVAPSVWTVGAGKDVDWPTGQGAKGSDGVTAVVKQTEGAIGYAEVSFAEANGLGVARIRNPAGRFVGPTPEAVSEAIRDAEIPPDLTVKANYKPHGPGAYPISTVTWALVRASGTDPAKARLLQSFLVYVLGPGQEAAAPLSYAALPKPLAVRALAAVYGMQAG